MSLDRELREAIWQWVWEITHCMDCAGYAVNGLSWGRSTGPLYCWAKHRPHTPTDPTYVPLALTA